MSGKKCAFIFAGIVLAAGLFSASITAVLVSDYYSKCSFDVLGSVCGKIIKNQPGVQQTVLSVLKEEKDGPLSVKEENMILKYGYGKKDFFKPAGNHILFFAVLGFFTGGLLFIAVLLFWRRKEAARIRELTDYLEKVNDGDSFCILQREEDDFSKLQDEIYKTVTELYQTREEAVKAKNNFAENLYNIAHQIKTPITSISLSAQMMEDAPSANHLEQIRRQIDRLTHLEEELLLLSRIDAGTLVMERKETDVFTLLMLAADNLWELFQKENVAIDVWEAGEAVICVDLEWTMEAVMNVLKNCMEHTEEGTVFCAYEQNPLYTQIRIWDKGKGFEREDIPHLFERFYRGQNAKSSGIGIGLAISRAIIESQNGTITAENMADGGACFEIRFYCH